MKVLITGGAGYLGCHLTGLLLEQGCEVRVFDRLCYGEDVLSGVGDDRLSVVRGDVRRIHQSEGLLDGIDVVVHLAGIANDPCCALNPDMTADVNVESTRELARLAAQAGVRRFILASSCAVYGQGLFDLLDEHSPPNPVSPLGESKLAAEQALRAAAAGNFEPVIARCATLYGLSPRMRFDLALNLMVADAHTHGRILVRGGGQQWRPMLHVRDAARAYWELIRADRLPDGGPVFNLGVNAQNHTIRDLAERVASRLGAGVRVEVPSDDIDSRNFRVDCSRFTSAFNFEPECDIEQGIDEITAYLSSGVNPAAEIYSNVKTLQRLMSTPVDEGGEPVASRFIPLARPSLGEEEELAVIEAFRSGWLTSGPKIAAFEKAFAAEVGASEAVAVTSCTAALHLSLVDAGVSRGDEVITSPITWASTGNTILNMGAVPVFADIDPATLNMNPSSLETKITERTRAIMPVHLAGHPADLGAIRAIAARHGLPVIEDAAHALGASWRGKPIGGLSDYTCFSMYAIKNITTMEGGMITLNDPERARHLRFLASNGMSTTAWDRYGRSAIASPAEVVEPGYKYLMGNVSAAMGLEQLKKLERFKLARRRIAGLYHAALADVEEIVQPVSLPEVGHAWHLYVVRLRLDLLTRTRDEIAYDLRRENIGTGVHFYGLHLHRFYRDRLGMKPEDLPEATKASMEILSIPLHPEMTDRHVHETVTALKKVLSHARR